MSAPSPMPERARLTVDALLEEAAGHGERTVSLVRLAVCTVLVARQSYLLNQEIRPGRIAVLLTFLAGALFSTWLLRLPPRRVGTHRMLRFAALLDAGIIFFALMPTVLNHGPEYPGMLRRLDIAAFLLAACATSLRLAVEPAALGAAVSGAAFVLVVMADLVVNRDTAAYDFQDVLTFAIMFLGAAALGIGGAARTRALVHRGCRAMLDIERTRHRLGAYISEELGTLGEESVRAGVRRKVAVLFAEIHGHTNNVDEVPTLNRYLEVVVPIIRTHGGVIDKHLGDSIMVVFGVPRARDDDARRALDAALAMEQALAGHNTSRARDGLPPLEHTIGIHHGDAVIGNIGTDERVQLSVIGEAVTVANRVQSMAEEIGATLLVSADAIDAAGDGSTLPTMTRRTAVRIRGRKEEVAVLSPV